jgi:hypothetical protein
MLWPAVAQDNRVTCVVLACFKNLEVYAVGGNKSRLGKVGWIIHLFSSYFQFRDVPGTFKIALPTRTATD